MFKLYSLLLFLLLFGILFFSLSGSSVVHSQTIYGIGNWIQTTSYPANIISQSCVSHSSYVYCVGGLGKITPLPTNKTYYATLSSSGIGNWQQTTNYPLISNSLYGQIKCVTNSSYIYCLTAMIKFPNPSILSLSSPIQIKVIANTYYAQLSSTGIGNWIQTTSYPNDSFSLNCVTAYGNIFCTNDQNFTGGVNSSYYAPMTSSGIGQWTQTTRYPIGISKSSCTESQGFMFCVGGSNGFPINNTYYAPLNSSGIGQWMQSVDYPINISKNSCVTTSGITYCVGGNEFAISFNSTSPTPQIKFGPTNSVYFSISSSAGVLGWYSTPNNYPLNVTAPQCVTNSSYIYCISGTGMTSSGNFVYTNASYYAPLSTNFPSTTTSTTTTSTITIYTTTGPTTYTSLTTTTAYPSTLLPTIVSTTSIPVFINGTSSIPVFINGTSSIPQTNPLQNNSNSTNSNKSATNTISTNQTKGGYLWLIIIVVILIAGLLIWLLIKKLRNKGK